MDATTFFILIQLQATYIKELEALIITNDKILALNKDTINTLTTTNIKLLSEYSALSDKLKTLYETSK